MSIDVLLVDDHPIVRQGIRSVITKDENINIVAQASNGKEAVELAKTKKPDVVIMDITLPVLNGLDASRQIVRHNKNIKILVLSMHENRALVEKALSYGVKGYVLKESAADEIIQAIEDVNSNKYFLSSKISSYVIDDFVSRKKTKILRSDSILTNREREVLQLIAEGSSNKEIAKELKLSLKTVMAHRNNIMQKLKIHNQAHLIRFALKEGIISI